MVDAEPFRAVRYDPAVAGDPAATSAPAYDEFERFTYARHRALSPYTVLELLAGGPRGDYAPAGATWTRWLRTGVLVRERAPSFYRYEQHEAPDGGPVRAQRGLLAAVRVEPPGRSVLTHEGVDPGRVRDRIARLAAVPADVSPIVALYRGAPSPLRAFLDDPPAMPPLISVIDEAGTDHRLWPIDDPQAMRAVATWLAPLRVVIADGHHRYAAALSLTTAGSGDARTLMHLVDVEAHGPRILPVHRLLDGVPPDVEDALHPDFALTPLELDARAAAALVAAQPTTAFALCLSDGRTLLARARNTDALARRLPARRSPRWRRLDTAVLEHGVLPRLGARVTAYRSDAVTALGELRSERRGGGDGRALALLRPVDADTVFAIAEAGETMPPKTTYFRPKPRAGLLLRPIDRIPAVLP